MSADDTAGRRLIALGVVAAVCLGFLVLAWPSISGSFGDSDEGINTSVWAYNSRSLRESGVAGSALGGRRLDGTHYATHPPLIVIETAIAERLAGEHRWVTRAPAWVGTIAAIALLALLSRALGVDWLTAGAATVATAATPMLFTYGLMLDTPVTSFPLGLAVALVWYRDWRRVTIPDSGQPSPKLTRQLGIGLLAFAASLAGWQAALLTGICAGTLLVLAARRHRGAGQAALPYLTGALVGAGLSIGWGWWTYGGITALTDKFTRRSGSAGGVSVLDVAAFQIPWLFQLLGLAAFGIIGCAFALRDRTFRPLAALSLSIVGVYCLLFREAAAGHQYWIYWSLFPALVGLTFTFRAMRGATRNVGLSTTAGGMAVIALALVIGVIDVARSTQAQLLIDQGREPADLLAATELAPGRAVYYIGQEFRPDSWILYNTGRHGQFLRSRDDLAILARDQPDTPVLILGICGDGDASAGFCREVTGSSDTIERHDRVVDARQLAGELGVRPAAPTTSGGPAPLPPPTPSAP